MSATYDEVRRTTERLAAPLSAEDMQVQSMPEASPTKWHLAHTSWFFEQFVLSGQPFRRGFDRLFNSYYESLGERHPKPERGVASRPSLDEVMAYRAHVDRGVAQAGDELSGLITLGLHHEQQHQELILTDVLHAFSRNPLEPAYAPRAAHAPAPTRPLRWVGFGGGLHEIGAPSTGFAFDHERPRHCVFVEPFALASRLVTNAELAEFIADGGYQTPALWLADGWDRVRTEQWHAPLYWKRENGSWTQLTFAGRERIELSAPAAHLSFYEADAYARWAQARLPTEAEWEVATEALPVRGNFLDTAELRPVASPPEQRLTQMYGDAWEWTSSAFAPYPGFRPLEGAAREYNGKFMCAQYVLRGGSCCTPASHMRASYRNFFPPTARWQLTGIRLARDAVTR